MDLHKERRRQTGAEDFNLDEEFVRFFPYQCGSCKQGLYCIKLYTLMNWCTEAWGLISGRLLKFSHHVYHLWSLQRIPFPRRADEREIIRGWMRVIEHSDFWVRSRKRASTQRFYSRASACLVVAVSLAATWTRCLERTGGRTSFRRQWNVRVQVLQSCVGWGASSPTPSRKVCSCHRT